MRSRARPSGTCTVRSTASRSSPTGTAAGRGAFVRSSLPVKVTIRRSRAASRASSRSWRSSVRGLRSPTWGSVSMRSSPSRGARRGKLSSSSPSRQTTRCGTERIGTSVQMVRWPVRKLARVGRPLQALGQEGADLGERQRDAVVGADARVVGDLAEDALQLRALPVVARRGVGEGVGGVGQGGRPGIDGLGVGERIDGAVEAVDELGEPAGEVDGAALDVVERQDARRTGGCRPRSWSRRPAGGRCPCARCRRRRPRA